MTTRLYFNDSKDVVQYVDVLLTHSEVPSPLTMIIRRVKSGEYCVTSATTELLVDLEGILSQQYSHTSQANTQDGQYHRRRKENEDVGRR